MNTYVYVVTRNVRAKDMTAADKLAKKRGIKGYVAVIEVNEKGEGLGGICRTDFADIVQTVVGPCE